MFTLEERHFLFAESGCVAIRHSIPFEFVLHYTWLTVSYPHPWFFHVNNKKKTQFTALKADRCSCIETFLEIYLNLDFPRDLL